MRRSSRIIGVVLLVLILLGAVIWYAVVREDSSGLLTVSFLDVGQGDAIFIESPAGTQTLIDGGTGTAVLRQLSSVMPWYDRTIDALIGTHPDQDHIGGLVDILPRYGINTVITSSVVGRTASAETFAHRIVEEGAHAVVANRGQRVELGGGAYLEVLFPDRTVPNVETNVGCVVTRLVYGETAFMLPCDTTVAVETYLVQLGTTTLKSNVLKAAHHGSKTSSAPLFVGFVDPEFAVYSRGCDNTYGHPSPETIATFEKFGIPTLDTCTLGTVTFVSDGHTVQLK